MKWFIKSRIKDLEYSRDWLWSLVAPKERGVPRIIDSCAGLVAPDFRKPLCLFCSYDAQGVIRGYVHHYLGELAEAGFDVVFVTSSDGLAATDRDRLRQRCVQVIHRENRGHDFYGWKAALRAYPHYAEHDGLLLANDSVIGPLFGIRDVASRLKDCDADIVGMTDSLRYHRHLQSYFLYCRPQVVRSEEFQHFFEGVAVLGFKRAVIRRYEVGFSRLMGARFRLAALYGVERVVAHLQYRDRPLDHINLTTRLWKPLIAELHFPFLKKSLLTGRRASLSEVAAALAAGGSAFDATLLAEVMQPA